MAKRGIIQKLPKSIEWLSSMVIMAKPGKIRIYDDPQDLNKAIHRPKDQMPTLDEVLSRLCKEKVLNNPRHETSWN